MAKAKKLPSGQWRALVYSHTTPDGKRHYESFTASTRAEAEMHASRFANNKARTKTSDLTVDEAIEGYLNAKTNVLSPSTIRAYRNMQRKRYGLIGKKKIKKLTTEDIQTFISQLSAEYSAKTVKNAYALLSSAVKFYASDIIFDPTLPTAIKKPDTAPSDNDVMMLYSLASDWMKQCIALAAFGSLRRGEIASLKYSDLKDNVIYIHSDMVMDENNNWIYKEIPKNQSSVRYVRLPEEVSAILGTGSPDEFIIKHNPNTISKMFIKLRNRIGSDIRFHDLRHYYASIGAAIGIPDIYLADFGGWRHDSPVMKSVYQEKITSIADKYSDRLNDHFSGLMKKAGE